MTAPPVIDETERARAGLYRLIGAALSHPPTSQLISALARLPVQEDGTAVAIALAAVRDQASITPLEQARRDYDTLFVGVARGELVPYESFYLTGFLHDRPLARLREDLATLGLAAEPGHSDPEDHAGTLCEVMAGLIDGGHDAPQPLDVQHRFFQRHMASWLDRFFADLASSGDFGFYAAVGALGRAFFSVERLAFQMEAS